MGCRNKVEYNCGSITYATCTKYESGVSRNSSLIEECRSVENTTQDIYNQLDVIDDKLDLSLLVSECTTLSEPRTVLSVISDLIREVCVIQGLLEQQQNLVTTLQTQIEELQANPCN